jgi:decaprenylphospho-beta-D-ribofuranose 2-oxidase
LAQWIAESPLAIARGAGLSYSPASFGAGACVIDMTHFDRVLGFEPQSGQVTVEPGISVGRLTAFLAERGRYLPALPGYPRITVGGCLAFDIHGKSQTHSGNFSRWVHSLVLRHVDHGEVCCSKDREREVFELTLGGLGLTGIITQVVLNTAALPGMCIQVNTTQVNDLCEAAELLRDQAASADISYSWHDLNLPKKQFGRGVVYIERFVPERQASHAELAPRQVTAHFGVPGWNRLTTRPALALYGALARRSSVAHLPLQQALFPIHGKEIYYALFGWPGFREYQVIIPHNSFTAFASDLQRLLNAAQVPITLGSLKVFKGEPRYIGFSGEGIALALDVPATRRSRGLFSQLDELVVRYRGVINLSKDSRVSTALCERTLPGYRQFASELRRFDSARRYTSALSKQIGL